MPFSHRFRDVSDKFIRLIISDLNQTNIIRSRRVLKIFFVWLATPYKFDHFVHAEYREFFCIYNWITKHLDKSGFDELVELGELLFSRLNQEHQFFKNTSSFFLLFNSRKIDLNILNNIF